LGNRPQPRRRPTAAWTRSAARRTVAVARGSHHEPEARLPAEERRALQRQDHCHRVLRTLCRTRRQRSPHGHDDRDRPRIPRSSIRRHVGLQEGTGWVEMGSDTLLRPLKYTSLVCSFLLASGWGGPAGRASGTSVSPPVADKQPKTITVHGDSRIDDYFWLR